jgi:hypothetical protein
MSLVLDAVTIGAALELPTSLARVTMMLLAEPKVTPQEVEKKQQFTDGCGRVYMSRLRQALSEKHDVELRSSRGFGYYLKREDKEYLTSVINEFHKQFT